MDLQYVFFCNSCSSSEDSLDWDLPIANLVFPEFGDSWRCMDGCKASGGEDSSVIGVLNDQWAGDHWGPLVIAAPPDTPISGGARASAPALRNLWPSLFVPVLDPDSDGTATHLQASRDAEAFGPLHKTLWPVQRILTLR